MQKYMKPMNKTLILLKFNFTRIPWVPWEEFQHNIIIFSSGPKSLVQISGCWVPPVHKTVFNTTLLFHLK